MLRDYAEKVRTGTPFISDGYFDKEMNVTKFWISYASEERAKVNLDYSVSDKAIGTEDLISEHLDRVGMENR